MAAPPDGVGGCPVETQAPQGACPKLKRLSLGQALLPCPACKPYRLVTHKGVYVGELEDFTDF